MNDIEVELYDINYIPDYVEAEEERQANEAIRQANEQNRIALYDDLENKKETDYWKGDKGDKGDPGEFITATITYDSQYNPSLDMTFAEIYAAIQNNQEVRLYDSGDEIFYFVTSYYSEQIEFTNVNDNGIIVIVLHDDNSLSSRQLYKIATVNSSSTNEQIPTAKAVYTAINNQRLETTDNKVTSITSSSTNTQYPSAKAVYTATNAITTDTKNNYAHTLTLSQNLTTGDLTVGISNYNGTTLDYGTVEGIATRDYVDDLVGDIGTALDEIQGEVI